MYDVWWLIAALILLALLGVVDVKTKKIPLWGLAGAFAMAAGYLCFCRDADALSIVSGLIPGAAMILTALVTHGSMGIGDGLLVTALGLGLGLERCMYVLMAALLLDCILSGILLLMHRATGKTQIPFVPFLTCGMGVMALVCSG